MYFPILPFFKAPVEFGLMSPTSVRVSCPCFAMFVSIFFDTSIA